MILTFAIVLFVRKKTAFGRHLIAVGGNTGAARATGIKTQRVTIIVYAISGALAGLSGSMLAAQVGTVDGSLGIGLELQVISIVVLGGATLAGGYAFLGTTLIAAFLLATISAALNILNVPSFYQDLSTGALLIMALSFNSIAVKRKSMLRKVAS
jgi:ribose transport system permease protein